MTQATGYVVNVLSIESGSEVESDVASGVTSITVADSFAFNEEGGQFTIDDGTAVYAYSSSDPFTETLFLSAPLDVSISANTPIKVYPPGVTKVAQVQFDDDNEGIRAVIPFSMVDRFDDGIRDAQDMESVHVSDDSGRWEIVAVDGQIARILGSYIDGEGLPPSEPTEAPVVSPDPTALAGSGAAVVRWPYVNDATAYDLHVSTTNSNPPDPTTLYMADVNSPVFVNFLNLESRTPIPTDVDTYFAIVARNAVGPAAPSAWVAGRAGVIDNTMLATSLAIIQNVVAELVQTQGLVIGGQTWNSESGLTIPGVLNFPPNNAEAANIWATLVARALTVQNNLLLQGVDNEMGFNAALELAAGVTKPKTKPTVSYSWPQTPAYGSGATSVKAIGVDWQSTTNKRWAVIEGSIVKEVVNGVATGVQWNAGGNQWLVDVARGTNCWYVLAIFTDNLSYGNTGALVYRITTLNDDFTLKYLPGFVVNRSTMEGEPRIAVEPGSSDIVHVVYTKFDGVSTDKLHRLEATINPSTGAVTVTLAEKKMTVAASRPEVTGVIFTTSIPGDASTRNLQVMMGGAECSVQPHKLTNSSAVDVAVSAGLFGNANGEPCKSLSLAPPVAGEDAYAYSIVSTGFIRKHGKQLSWASHEAAYSWYDDDATGGTHESMLSPFQSYASISRRAYLWITAPPVQQPILSNTPNKHKVYLSSTIGGTKRFQALTVPPDKNYVELSQFDAAGTTHPGVDGFIGAGVDPAVLRSEAEDATPEAYWWLKGDGSGRMGPYKWSNTGARIDGDPTYDTGWVAVGSLGNGDSPFASGGSASLTYRRIGNIVMVRFARDSSAALDRSGTYGNFTNLSLHAAALPSSVRPGSTVQIPGRMADAPQTVVITAAGMVEWWGGVGANWASGSAFRAEGTYIIG